jgi:phospholipase/carboxylesterase
MTAPDLIHRFVRGSDDSRHPLLLLHRTGGNENDFIEVGARIAPGASLLGLRGGVVEDGKARYFRRLSHGRFDLDDLRLRTREIAEFLLWACAHYGIKAPIAFGFSNGANAAWSLILSNPTVLKAAILLRPMLAFDPAPARTLDGFPVLVIAGRKDSTVPSERAHELPDVLRAAGADVTLDWSRGAHDFTEDDAHISESWISRLEAREQHRLPA